MESKAEKRISCLQQLQRNFWSQVLWPDGSSSQEAEASLPQRGQLQESKLIAESDWRECQLQQEIYQCYSKVISIYIVQIQKHKAAHAVLIESLLLGLSALLVIEVVPTNIIIHSLPFCRPVAGCTSHVTRTLQKPKKKTHTACTQRTILQTSTTLVIPYYVTELDTEPPLEAHLAKGPGLLTSRFSLMQTWSHNITRALVFSLFSLLNMPPVCAQAKECDARFIKTKKDPFANESKWQLATICDCSSQLSQNRSCCLCRHQSLLQKLRANRWLMTYE